MKTKLINAILADPQLLEHNAKQITLCETHLSWVLLTEKYAYKIKKPLDLGFADFSTLAKRKKFCKLELQYNKKLAPEIYLDVIKITKPNLEYAVKMLRLDNTDVADKLTPSLISQVADDITAFHASTEKSAGSSILGNFFDIKQAVLENFTAEIKELNHADQLANWSEQQLQSLQNLIEQRHTNGWVRACHGDLHLGNLAYHNDKIVIFDCIEFNENFRWVDTISDIAFLLMDLELHDLPELANTLLNQYLINTGDYRGLLLLRFYTTYRAMVRCKIATFTQAKAKIANYLNYALAQTNVRTPELILMHGVSGSGKTHQAKQLVLQHNAIYLSSDIERKRLFNHPDKIYNPDNIALVYAKIAELAGYSLQAGFTTVVDASFLSKKFRGDFIQLADSLNIKIYLISCHEPLDILKKRLAARQDKYSDADIDVLRQQLATMDELSLAEKKLAPVFAAATLPLSK